MTVTIIRTAEDRQWLAEVHGVTVRPGGLAAMLGNEDAPDRIELYRGDHIGTCYAVLVPREDGTFNAMTEATIAETAAPGFSATHRPTCDRAHANAHPCNVNREIEGGYQVYRVGREYDGEVLILAYVPSSPHPWVTWKLDTRTGSRYSGDYLATRGEGEQNFDARRRGA